VSSFIVVIAAFVCCCINVCFVLCSYDVYTRMAKNVPSLNFLTVMYVKFMKFSEIVLHQTIAIHHACNMAA